MTLGKEHSEEQEVEQEVKGVLLSLTKLFVFWNYMHAILVCKVCV